MKRWTSEDHYKIISSATLIKKPLSSSPCDSCQTDNNRNPIIIYTKKHYNNCKKIGSNTYRICIPCANGMSDPKVVESLKMLGDRNGRK